MKIVYIASSGGPGGASVALYNLIKGLYLKHDLHVVFPQKGFFSESVESLGIKCHYLPFYNLTMYPRLLGFRRKIRFFYDLLSILYSNHIAFKALLKLCDDIKPNIIHTNVGPLDIGFKVARHLHIKHVWHIREYQDLDFGIRFFPSKRKFSSMLSCSENYSIAITNDIFNYWKLDPTKAKVIYDGVVGDNEHSYNPVKNNYFLFVGRLEDAKGIKILLRAYGAFCRTNKNFCLLVAGKGSDKYMDECKQIIKVLGIENMVSFLGHRTDVYKLMEDATALVVPSRFEGFGFITTEAMYNHCLVIGKNTAGTKEQFDNGLYQIGSEIGLRFETEKDLLSVFHKVVNLSSLEYNKIVENAYSVVIENYTISNHINNIEFSYSTITN